LHARFIIAWHYGVDLFYKVLVDKVPKGTWYRNLFENVREPIHGIKYLWLALWVVDQIAYVAPCPPPPPAP